MKKVFEKYDIKNDLSEHASGSASVSVEDDKGSIYIHFVWISSIEPYQPHPQQSYICLH